MSGLQVHVLNAMKRLLTLTLSVLLAATAFSQDPAVTAQDSLTQSLELENLRKIAFKDEDEEGKFNLTLFWKSVIVYCCMDLADKTISTEELRVKARVVMSTKDCIDMITKVRGANKRNAFDIWLLDVRDILGEEYGSN